MDKRNTVVRVFQQLEKGKYLFKINSIKLDEQAKYGNYRLSETDGVQHYFYIE